jgi:hypothetical protein
MGIGLKKGTTAEDGSVDEDDNDGDAGIEIVG